MVVTVHHLNNSRSQTILWLMEELGVEYEIKKYQRGSDMLAPPELKQVHPLGRAPIITDNGKVFAETAVVIEYLVEKYGPQLGPPTGDEDAKWQYKYWLHFAEGSAMPLLVMSLLFKNVTKQAPFFIRPIAKAISNGVHSFYIDKGIKANTDFMEAELAKNPQNWFVRDFSAADIMLSFPIMGTSSRAPDGLKNHPKLAQWLATVKERPAWKRAIEKGGEFNMF